MVLKEFLREWNSDAATMTVHTSGSTGTPKSMSVEKKRMLASARITCDFLGLTASDTALLCMNLNYIGAKMVVVRTIERGMSLVDVPPSGHPYADLPEQWRKHGRITFAAMVPMQVYNALESPEETEWLRSIDHLIIGGGAIDSRLERKLRTFPNHVWSTYGMTETLSHIALRRLNGDDASEWYKPFDTVEISQTADGCLVIDAPLIHEGKLETNDRVEIVKGKGFRILGRKDNVINSGGIKIQIEEVERNLRSFMPVPFLITRAHDEKFGECVVLLTEATDMAEMSEICHNVLPNYWVPRRYIHVDKIPIAGNDKPARAEAERIANLGKE